MNCDVLIIGGGPAGLFTAYSLANSGLKVVVLEKGKDLQNRVCPAIKNNQKCLHCSDCSIMTGLGGCSPLSDGKVPITNDYGGELWKKIGKEKSLFLQNKADEITKRFFEEGIETEYPKLYSSANSKYKAECLKYGLNLLNANIRHLGSDNGPIIYKYLINYLVNNGVKIYTNSNVVKIIKMIDGYQIKRLNNAEVISAKYVVIATGRSGSSWTKSICKELNIPTLSNKVDIGIRFECPNEIWKEITDELYESKIVYRTKTYNDLVRTFCMNPSGEVVSENTNGLITVNGHSFEDMCKKTSNTNFALLVSKTFTEPFNNSNEYGESIIKLSNMLGGGVIVQRFGDLIRGRRSTNDKIKENTVIPTLKAEAGDLSLVLPKRILDDIIEMIYQLNNIAPGTANDDNLLYGVECKFYDNVIETDNNFEAENYPNLFFAGDCSGITHCISQASANGLAIGEIILNR